VTVPAPRDEATVGVPDVPDAVLGWRTWRVGRRAQRRTELIAPLAGTPWPAARPLIASCASRSHTPPGDTCRCGLYAVADPGILEWGPSDHEVLGVVALWGEVVEGPRGWRAARGYPRFLVTGPGIAAEQRAALARRYGIPVHRSDVPPRALASLLGTDRALADALRHGRDVETGALFAAHMPDWVARWDAGRLAADAARGPRPATLGRVWRRR
jgi:hypothetical protein